MARTFRNRKSVPKGLVVRDDGREYFPCCPNREAQRESWKEYSKHWVRSRLCPCHAQWQQGPRYRRSYMRCEKKKYRKLYQREYRAKVKQRMLHEDYENIPRFRRTGGWLTW